jgi:hypothetical protein
MKISGAKKLIDSRGGYRLVAEKLRWPLSTVHTFYRNDQAPDYRWSIIEALPKQKKRAADAPAQDAA